MVTGSLTRFFHAVNGLSISLILAISLQKVIVQFTFQSRVDKYVAMSLNRPHRLGLR